MSVPNKFKSFEFNYGTDDDKTNILLKPIDYYICHRDMSNPTPFTERRIVMMEFTINKTKDGVTETKIAKLPYYVSDGYTNHLRANMLYPFFCFNDYDSTSKIEGADCPNKTNTDYGVPLPQWGLYKANMFRNINFTTLSERIKVNFNQEIIKCLLDMSYYDAKAVIISFFRFYYTIDLNLDTFRTLYFNPIQTLTINHTATMNDAILQYNEIDSTFKKRFEEAILDILNELPFIKNTSTTVTSVLPRIENIIDLIISIVNTEILNYNEININKYMPLELPDSYEYNPSELPSKFNTDIDGTPDSESREEIRSEPIGKYIPTSTCRPTSIYRKQLLKELHNLANVFVNSGYFSHADCELVPKVISCREFNGIAKICTGKDRLFIPESEDNINIINEVIDATLAIVRIKVTEETRETIKNPIIEILMDRTDLSYPARLSRPYVKSMIENVWNAKCKNKYLKYKKKYLKLKKELNNL